MPLHTFHASKKIQKPLQHKLFKDNYKQRPSLKNIAQGGLMSYPSILHHSHDLTGLVATVTTDRPNDGISANLPLNLVERAFLHIKVLHETFI